MIRASKGTALIDSNLLLTFEGRNPEIKFLKTRKSDREPLEVSIHSIDDGAPHITINTGLTYLEYGDDGAPMGQITAATLTTVDPDTKDINIMYQIYETPKHGAIINTDLGAAVSQFSQADVNANKIRFEEQ